jgi:hypothetical protein
MGDEADGSDGEGERALTVAESVGVPNGGLHANLHGHGVGGEFVGIFFVRLFVLSGEGWISDRVMRRP